MKFLPSVSIYVFKSIRTTNSHEGILRVKSEISERIFLYALLRRLVQACATTKKRAPPEKSLSFLQNMSIYCLSEIYKLSICSFLEYCYTIYFVHDISCSSKGCLAHNRNMHRNFFSFQFHNSLYQAFHLSYQDLFSILLK